MKVKNFKVPIYNYEVRIIELKKIIKTENDFDLSEHLKWINVPISELGTMIDRYDGADVYSNSNKKRFLIILFYHRNKKEKVNTLGHEQRHIEDHILEGCNIQDIEAAGYLAGFLTKEILT